MAIESNYQHDLENAQELMLWGQYREAKEVFYRLTQEFPSMHEPWYFLGLCALNEDMVEEAIKYFNISISKNSKYFDAYIELGEAYLILEDYDMAKSNFEAVLEKDQFNGRAHLGLGRLYEDLGKLEQAIHHYEEACRFGDFWDAPKLELSSLFLKCGRYIEADNILNSVLKEGLIRGNQAFIGDELKSSRLEIAKTIQEIKQERAKIEEEFQSRYNIPFENLKVFYDLLQFVRSYKTDKVLEIYREIKTIQSISNFENEPDSFIFLNSISRNYSVMEMQTLHAIIILELSIDSMVESHFMILWDSCSQAR